MHAHTHREGEKERQAGRQKSEIMNVLGSVVMFLLWFSYPTIMEMAPDGEKGLNQGPVRSHSPKTPCEKTANHQFSKNVMG